MKTIVAATKVLVVVGLFCTVILPLSAAPSPPEPAISAGYTVNTFSSEFTAKTVDAHGTGDPGFKWYPWKFYGQRMTNLSAIVLNPDNSLTLTGDKTGPNGEIASITPIASYPRFIGAAFGGGGYFEAVFKFNPEDIVKSGLKPMRSWPAWWSNAIEALLNQSGDHWVGQPPGYCHHIEADFFEYNNAGKLLKGEQNYYGSTMQDWYGTRSGGVHRVSNPAHGARMAPEHTDFTKYHRYGFLWVPAKPMAPGFAKYYFDGQQVGEKTEWTQFRDQQPPPSPPWVSGVIDNDHLVLILGTGIGQPMTIRSVNVWQASAAQDMFNPK